MIFGKTNVADQLEQLIPECEKWELEQNPGYVMYQSVEEYLEVNYYMVDSETAFESEEDEKRAIERDEMWQLTWYPTSPVGHCLLQASSLEKLFERLEGME